MPPTRQSFLQRLFAASPASQPAASLNADPDRLPPNSFGLQFLYVHGVVQIDDQRLGDVGVRFKGNSSYQLGSRGLKCPLKINFNRYIQGQKFHGLTQLNLNNNAFDDSEMRETLSYAVLRGAGVPAPRTTYALVYLTVDRLYQKQCLGLYTVIEAVNKPFLKAHFGSNKGLLLKPELRGRGLVYLGNDWSQYESIYNSETDGNQQARQRFISFVSLIHRADDSTFALRIGEYLDINAFLRFLAVNALMANMDSMLATGHNFYLYVNPDDGRIHWIPWDMNMSFGGFNWVGSADELIRLSIARPYVGSNRLIERLMAIESVGKTYRQHLQRMTQTVFAAEKLQAPVEQLQVVVDKANAEIKATSPLPGEAPRLPGLRMPPLRQFISGRMQSVADQLEGRGDAYIPHFRFFPGQRMADTRPTTRPAVPH